MRKCWKSLRENFFRLEVRRDVSDFDGVLMFFSVTSGDDQFCVVSFLLVVIRRTNASERTKPYRTEYNYAWKRRKTRRRGEKSTHGDDDRYSLDLTPAVDSSSKSEMARSCKRPSVPLCRFIFIYILVYLALSSMRRLTSVLFINLVEPDDDDQHHLCLRISFTLVEKLSLYPSIENVCFILHKRYTKLSDLADLLGENTSLITRGKRGQTYLLSVSIGVAGSMDSLRYHLIFVMPIKSVGVSAVDVKE